MSEQAKTERDDAPREQEQPESADLNDEDLANVSGGRYGGKMVVQHDGGGSGTAPLD